MFTTIAMLSTLATATPINQPEVLINSPNFSSNELAINERISTTCSQITKLDEYGLPKLIMVCHPSQVLAMSGKPPKCETVIEIDEKGEPKAKVKCTF